MNNKSNIILFLVIILAVFSRLFITIPNFSAIGSLALFCGAMANRNRFSILIPFIALLAGDLMMAGTGKMYSDYYTDGYFMYVYTAFALTWFIGRGIKNRIKVSNIVLASVLASVSFFFITNFGSWMQMELVYPRSAAGLGQSYLAGLVFYKGDLLSNFFLNQVAGDLFFSLVFFGGYLLITRQSPDKLIPIKVKS
jgi:hypothetical protein